MRLTRRRFLQSSLAAAAAAPLLDARSYGRVLGANDAIRVAIAGLNGRGHSHIAEFAPMNNVQIVYLVDPDTATFANRVREAEGKSKGKSAPKTEQDIRKVLERKDVDAISIATPNHWHSLMTIWACQAEKDVYVEKPCSHNVHEGRVAVEAARKHKRIVQHGTQSRSSDSWAELAEIVKGGKYGKLLVSRALCYKPRPSIGKCDGEQKPPATMDYDLWCGPAPLKMPRRNGKHGPVHYDWHWIWDTGNGDIGNQGVHQMDIARWMIPGATLPKSAISVGGRFGYVDDGETPNTQVAILDFGETQLIFEVRGLPTKSYQNDTIGNILHFEHGTVAPVDHKEGTKTSKRPMFFPKGKTDPEPLVKVKAAPRGGSHFANFIDAVRSRKQEALHADILEGHYSSACCHLANIPYQLGKDEAFDPKTKAFGDNKDAYEALERMEEHLSVGNKVDLKKSKLHVGRKITLDPKAETVVGDKEAAAMLTRDYRKGYVVPEKI